MEKSGGDERERKREREAEVDREGKTKKQRKRVAGWFTQREKRGSERRREER